MAGRGPAPKEASQRRRTVTPARGEWIDLPAAAGHVPKLPRGTWTARTRACWESWWTDPASTQWTEADRAAVLELAYLHADLADGNVRMASEVRQRMDILGLSQKGKRDLRWRVPGGDVEEKRESRPPATVRRLHAVDPTG